MAHTARHVSAENFLRAQNIQNRLIANLSPKQRERRLKNFSPVLGQSGDTAMAVMVPGRTSQTLLIAGNFRQDARRIGNVLRHELGHQLLGGTFDSARGHATMLKFGRPVQNIHGETVGAPTLVSKVFGGEGVFRAILERRTSGFDPVRGIDLAGPRKGSSKTSLPDSPKRQKKQKKRNVFTSLQGPLGG